MKIRLSELRKKIREELETQKTTAPIRDFVVEPLSSPLTVDINSVFYGNAPLEFHKISQDPKDHIKNWFIEHGHVKKLVQEAPSNDSEITKKDLARLVEMTSKATAKDITFARHVDDLSNLAQTFIDLLSEMGHEEDMESFFRIEGQSEGLLYYLKDLINRPRPYQLARLYGYPVYPLIRTDAMTASYPSGHALAGFIMGEYYSRKYPDSASKVRKLGKKIAESREVTGIHYPSDTEAAKKIVQIIICNNLIQD